ncbi:YheC/YheD family protein [Brevibacillus sp. H7]|uniref:YheC/YheD family endospore coat-associated protein n=1 Tax=Brevibacillus sp. H7 TaxID=3349138 RepID=UPI0037F8A012
MSYVPTIVQAVEPNEAEIDLYLSQQHMRKLNLTPCTLTVQFGSQTVQARVSGMERTGPAFIRPSLARALFLPTGYPLLVRYQANQQCLVFGPYLGILVSSYNAQFPSSPFGLLTAFYNEVADTYRQRGGIVCAFRLKDVNWETRTLRGLVRRNGAWRLVTLPLPQCIYNRLTSRQTEKSDNVGAWIQRCKDLQIPFFNERFLNKWHVHTALAKEAQAASYLPKTVRYLGLHELQSMLSEFRTLYVKPTNGSMGRGIYRIRRSAEGYLVTNAGAGTRLFGSLGSLHQFLNKRTKSTSYLLQQALPLIGISQRPADFRVLVQKNRQGEWAVTSMVARVGQNRIVSNIARGGSMMSPVQALNVCGPWMSSIRPSAQTLRSVALKLSHLLEQSLAGQYAELGIDLGVDVQGRIWLLEVNSKPSKQVNTVPGAAGTESPLKRIRPSVLRLHDYATHVSGYPYTPKPKHSRIIGKNKRKGKPAKKKSRR